MFKGIWRDLVHAGRSLAKARAFTFVCVVSLGIGMVPVIAIPYSARESPDAASRREHGGSGRSRHDATWLARGRRRVVLSGLHGPARRRYRDCDDRVDRRREHRSRFRLRQESSTESVATMFVSANYFKTIGVALARGPGFDASGG